MAKEHRGYPSTANHRPGVVSGIVFDDGVAVVRRFSFGLVVQFKRRSRAGFDGFVDSTALVCFSGGCVLFSRRVCVVLSAVLCSFDGLEVWFDVVG